MAFRRMSSPAIQAAAPAIQAAAPAIQAAAPAIQAAAPAIQAAAPAIQAPPGFFEGFGTTAVINKSAYIQPGSYILKVRDIKLITSTDPKKMGQNLVALNFQVEEVLVSYPSDATPPRGWGASNLVGEAVGTVVNTTAHRRNAFATIKGLLVAIAGSLEPGITESSLSPQEWEQELADVLANPHKFDGVVVKCDATKGFTKGTQGSPPTNWTYISFSPVG